MQFNYTNYHGIGLDISLLNSNGGLMLSASYSDEHLKPEVPMLKQHSWMGGKCYIAVHHLGLQGFEYSPDGDDFITLKGETEEEVELVENGRYFQQHNQILMLPSEE